MLANGFAADLLAGLVPAGLAMVLTESVRAGGPTIKSERFMITDAGRRATAGPQSRSDWVRVILPQPVNQVAISPGSAYRAFITGSG